MTPSSSSHCYYYYYYCHCPLHHHRQYHPPSFIVALSFYLGSRALSSHDCLKARQQKVSCLCFCAIQSSASLTIPSILFTSLYLQVGDLEPDHFRHFLKVAIEGPYITQTVMSCFSFLFGRKVDPSSKRSFDVDEELSGINNVKLYSYKELRTATEDFSPANKIGEGGFGSVYKGRLRDGKVAAIKVLSAESRQGVNEFLTEINVISEIEHENLVKLYGCCVEGIQRILVYNYLENNSLAQTLLGGGHSNIQFSWRTRTSICIGVARGLAYLHEQVRPYIVHRDIKASNILLDKDLTAKIADFGLAKLIPANLTHVSTRVAGTIGYLAPEYAIRGQLTRKADIYSFGVLLVEIVSGRCNTNTRLPAEEQYLLERTWDLYERRELVVLVDTSLDGDFDAEEACKFLKIGLLCTQDNPKLRPSMSTVIKMLTGEKDVDDSMITKPGLISDFMELKVRVPLNTKTGTGTTSSYNISSGSENQDNLTMTSGSSTIGTMTFTTIYDRSI